MFLAGDPTKVLLVFPSTFIAKLAGNVARLICEKTVKELLWNTLALTLHLEQNMGVYREQGKVGEVGID